MLKPSKYIPCYSTLINLNPIRCYSTLINQVHTYPVITGNGGGPMVYRSQQHAPVSMRYY